MKYETSLRKDIKTAWIDGCKGLVGWLASFGKPKEEPEYTNIDKGFTKEAVKEWKKYGMMRKKDIGQYVGLDRPKRARGPKGKYKGDDKSTPDINEAWVGGKAPKKGKKKNG